jgi:hypothetical protein
VKGLRRLSQLMEEWSAGKSTCLMEGYSVTRRPQILDKRNAQHILNSHFHKLFLWPHNKFEDISFFLKSKQYELNETTALQIWQLARVEVIISPLHSSVTIHNTSYLPHKTTISLPASLLLPCEHIQTSKATQFNQPLTLNLIPAPDHQIPRPNKAIKRNRNTPAPCPRPQVRNRLVPDGHV